VVSVKSGQPEQRRTRFGDPSGIGARPAGQVSSSTSMAIVEEAC